jgi:hypothetical protein
MSAVQTRIFYEWHNASENAKRCIVFSIFLIGVTFFLVSGLLLYFEEAPVECDSKDTRNQFFQIWGNKRSSLLVLITFTVSTAICAALGAIFFNIGPKTTSITLFRMVVVLVSASIVMMGALSIKASNGTLCKFPDERGAQMAFRISGEMSMVQITLLGLCFCVLWAISAPPKSLNVE